MSNGQPKFKIPGSPVKNVDEVIEILRKADGQQVVYAKDEKTGEYSIVKNCRIDSEGDVVLDIDFSYDYEVEEQENPNKD